jgi:hypothetical protein
MATKRKPPATHVAVWKIGVVGYGYFLYVGTELEAWTRARLKAAWERLYSEPSVQRLRSLTVKARIYAKHGPDTLDGAPYHGKDDI